MCVLQKISESRSNCEVLPIKLGSRRQGTREIRPGETSSAAVMTLFGSVVIILVPLELLEEVSVRLLLEDFFFGAGVEILFLYRRGLTRVGALHSRPFS